MRLWAVMYENFANFGTLTIWDWLFLAGITGLYVYLQRKW